MRVSDYVLKSVGFVGELQERSKDGVVSGDLHATGFFTRIASQTRRGVYYLYFVTARHVAEDLADRDIYVLVNKRGGGTTEILAAEPANWFLHPTDLTCDVAVCQMVYSPPAELLPIPSMLMLTPEMITKAGIGIGDETFTTGLFSEIPNTTRNIPIVRHGNIAMMPGEQIQTELGHADVYLVEARSIGGLSGSPVFVRPTGKIPVRVGDDLGALLGLRDKVYLLGLMHGHWDVKESEINNPSLHHDRKRGVNYGIAIVTPAIKIIETLNRPDLVEMRMKNDEMLRQLNVPGMDSAKGNENSEPTFTKEDFESSLKKAGRKIAPATKQ